MQDRRLAGAGAWVDDVNHRASLAKELEERRTKARERCKRMRLKPWTSVQVKDFLPLL